MRIDQTTGAPSLIEAFLLGGNNLRSFSVDPGGTYLFAMLQRSFRYGSIRGIPC